MNKKKLRKILEKIIEELIIHYKKKQELESGSVSKLGGKDLFGGKNPFASRRQKINSDEDAANAKLEDGPITASNNITNGSKDDLPPPPPPPMPSKVTKARHTLVEKCITQHQPKSNN